MSVPLSDASPVWAPVDTEPARPRRSDSVRNREAVVDALLSLHRDGNLRPSSNEIAERAGISARSLFRYFTDIDDLARAAIARVVDRTRSMVEVDVAVDAPLEDRIGALVESRVRVFDAMGPTGIVVRLRAPFKPLIAAQLARARAFYHHQTATLLSRELDALGATGPTVLASIEVLCSFESYQLLRVDQQLTRVGAIETLTTSITRLLGPTG